ERLKGNQLAGAKLVPDGHGWGDRLLLDEAVAIVQYESSIGPLGLIDEALGDRAGSFEVVLRQQEAQVLSQHGVLLREDVGLGADAPAELEQRTQVAIT